ncbi:hypothetical protein SAMN05421780_101761 [Flexibacter flexilis DSM 6793]|uniref:Uncharacterized protein n=1 Tax=Flexibacter flexilis DSM 6793 TaxID=927664 RepID=A0A1I1EK07_9BACT|nr:hypothetical protein [Flexibacter flexilis]SFB85233.1 hypothetical protein SAMN05421780_101761 [Flexibacter flexilis DSM 6793]
MKLRGFEWALVAWIGSFSNVFAQNTDKQWTLLRTVSLPSSFVCGSATRDGLWLVATRDGVLQMFDSTGNARQRLSPDIAASPSHIEAWNPLKIMVFYRDLQQIIYTDRFLLPSPAIGLPEQLASSVRTACPSADNQLWAIDDNDFSLKKIDLLNQQILLTTPLALLLPNQQYDWGQIHEYQNLVYVANKPAGGLIVFDNMGNLKKKLPMVNALAWNFWGDEIYWPEATGKPELHFFNLYNFKERTISIPIQTRIDNVFINQNYWLVISENQLYFYKLTN